MARNTTKLLYSNYRGMESEINFTRLVGAMQLLQGTMPKNSTETLLVETLETRMHLARTCIIPGMTPGACVLSAISGDASLFGVVRWALLNCFTKYS